MNRLAMRGTAMLAGAVMALSIATSAFAAVTFDPATGTGFVGKGDVQLAFGWNNAQLQTNAKDVSFSFESTDTYSAVCTFITGAGTRGEQTHNVTIPRHTAIKAALDGDPRQTKGQKQFTGYILKGFGATTTTGTVPVVGESCVANEEGVARDGTWSSVTLISSTGGLFVTFNGSSVAL